jgi:hypothetical protein
MASRRPAWRRAAAVAVVVIAVGYSWLAAGAAPFTAAADAATAAPIALVGAIGLRALLRPAAAGETDAGRAGPFVLAIAIAVVLEVATYLAGLGGRRHAYPTLSSLYGAAARLRAAKASLFALWIALGWSLTRR